ncbi:uncharacterized protein ColSpa_03617 [Colletotrichum spaethianum]|uniref:Uncharacterized protein n=1 Tax=Colletotrichum spaethianum TaxID=700344 RepID=A0AA37L7H8_9PEZI|nr:uncharacterized protein ColSpa_03617 [Colletotrichum spaethianum]GKT43436.1 hypothetical protein ColSpa_03617 [Colletotrichum spaethianum]
MPCPAVCSLDGRACWVSDVELINIAMLKREIKEAAFFENVDRADRGWEHGMASRGSGVWLAAVS